MSLLWTYWSSRWGSSVGEGAAQGLEWHLLIGKKLTCECEWNGCNESEWRERWMEEWPAAVVDRWLYCSRCLRHQSCLCHSVMCLGHAVTHFHCYFLADGAVRRCAIGHHKKCRPRSVTYTGATSSGTLSPIQYMLPAVSPKCYLRYDAVITTLFTMWHCHQDATSSVTVSPRRSVRVSPRRYLQRDSVINWSRRHVIACTGVTNIPSQWGAQAESWGGK